MGNSVVVVVTHPHGFTIIELQFIHGHVSMFYDTLVAVKCVFNITHVPFHHDRCVIRAMDL